MATKYEIHLDGVHALDLSMTVLRDLVDLLVEGAQRSARLAAEGRSVARGTPPIWLIEAADVRLVGFHEGSLGLAVSARPLVEMAPELFAQQALSLGARNIDATAMDLLVEAIEDAMHGVRDSERLDPGVLQLLARTRGLFGRGPTRLRLGKDGGKIVEVDAAAVEKFQALVDETPVPHVERVLGMLDTLTISNKTFVLKVDERNTLRGFATGVSTETLKELHGKHAVVEGVVTFRPSGQPHRIDADYAALATDHDAVWARLPRAQAGLPRPVYAAGGDLRSLYGQWPGEEGDDEVFDALEKFS